MKSSLKALIRSYFCIFAILISFTSNAQWDCGGQVEQNYFVPSQSCARQSPTFSDKYYNQNWYIPNANTAIKTIQVNLNFWQKDDGS